MGTINKLTDARVRKASAGRYGDGGGLLLEVRADGEGTITARNWTMRYTSPPKLGSKAIEEVTTADVLAVLTPIWTGKPETASRVRGRVEAVIDDAAAHGWFTAANPARWRGHLINLLAAPKKIARVVQHAALDFHQAGAFMRGLHGMPGISARALEFLVLTAARSGEVRGATWAEFDLEHGVWTVPGERMKAGVEHRVALSTR